MTVDGEVEHVAIAGVDERTNQRRAQLQARRRVEDGAHRQQQSAQTVAGAVLKFKTKQLRKTRVKQQQL